MAVAAGSPEPLNVESLRVGVVGGGPAGLLLAHRLLQAGVGRVEVFELRGDPRSQQQLEDRAYALGLGLRGRTAIRTVDEELWRAVERVGLPSNRFKAHLPVGGISVDLRTPEDGVEPSLLLYQLDLCGALLDELELRYADSGRLATCFGSAVSKVDPVRGTFQATSSDGKTKDCAFDLVAGCDGVRSAVRAGFVHALPGFDEQLKSLTGNLKVLRLDSMPGEYEGDTVHIVVGSGGMSAFLEPTVSGCCALVGWTPGRTEPALSDDRDAVVAEDVAGFLAGQFPTLAEDLLRQRDSVTTQWSKQTTARASTVKCNTFHCGKAVLVGDAAHATGGATGQGCNSALQDSVALADVLTSSGHSTLADALLDYSSQRVPEGQALLDLSVGPNDQVVGGLRRGLYQLASTLSNFGVGDPPLQTLLTTSLINFADIRRRKDFFFGEFPSSDEFRRELMALEGASAAIPQLSLDEDSDIEAAPVTQLLSKALPRTDGSLEILAWDAPKATLTLEEMVQAIDAGVRAREWFVTGQVMPELFASDFDFKDPGVSLSGIRDYGVSVRRLFDQSSSRVEVVQCAITAKGQATPAGDECDVVTVEWRLSGAVNALGGLRIKPYVVSSDLYVRRSDGLIALQEDRFDIPTWDIVLSAFAPGLPFLSQDAPPVEELRRQRGLTAP